MQDPTKRLAVIQRASRVTIFLDAKRSLFIMNHQIGKEETEIAVRFH